MAAGTWAGYAAAVWAGMFALRGVYWALGGTVGLGTVAEGLQVQAAAGDPTVFGMLWAAVVLLLVGTVWAVALARGWRPVVVPAGRRGHSRRLPAWLMFVPPAAGGGLLVVHGGLYISGLVFGDRADSATWWYGLLWGPWFVLGGLLFLAAANGYRRRFAQHRERAGSS